MSDANRRVGESKTAASDCITDAMVEAAVRVFYRNQTGTDLLDTSGYRDNWLALARRALEAAFAVAPVADSPTDTGLRRRPAGPWEPVPEQEDNRG
jgi:hypothetical protein